MVVKFVVCKSTMLQSWVSQCTMTMVQSTMALHGTKIMGIDNLQNLQNNSTVSRPIRLICTAVKLASIKVNGTKLSSDL